MYLVNRKSLELEEFVGDLVPSYAILSHRWGSEELSFKEVYKKRIDQGKRGYEKLVGVCRIAATFNLDYVWVDTCCINKQSSAELSEAINSMYSWYSNAKMCVVYLEDVDCQSFDECFQASVWFTRSWTLQELLAPSDVRFFDRDWHALGTKWSLAEQLTVATNIPRTALLNERGLWRFPLATRMSWASSRKATRAEDVAYSLLGIFEVNMPLLYGEGHNAFIRLQEEIIRRSTDPTFLLWGLGQTDHGLLASSPDQYPFVDHDAVLTPMERTKVPISLTNIGLEIELSLVRWELNTYAALIAYEAPSREKDETTGMYYYAMLLRKDIDNDLLYRVGIVRLARNSKFFAWRVRRKLRIMRGTRNQDYEISLSEWYRLQKVAYGFEIDYEQSFQLQPAVCDPSYHVLSESGKNTQWSERLLYQGLRCTFDEPAEPGLSIVECNSEHSGMRLWIELCFDFDSQPCVHVRKSPRQVSYANYGKVSVIELSELVEWKIGRRRAGIDIGWLQSNRIADQDTALITDQETGDASLLIRWPAHSDGFHQIPAQLLPPDQKVWIGFFSPQRSNAEQAPSYWNFKLSSFNVHDPDFA